MNIVLPIWNCIFFVFVMVLKWMMIEWFRFYCNFCMGSYIFSIIWDTICHSMSRNFFFLFCFFTWNIGIIYRGKPANLLSYRPKKCCGCRRIVLTVIVFSCVNVQDIFLCLIFYFILFFIFTLCLVGWANVDSMHMQFCRYCSLALLGVFRYWPVIGGFKITRWWVGAGFFGRVNHQLYVFHYHTVNWRWIL